MVPPSPDLQRRFNNTDRLVKSGMSYLVPDLVAKYPQDYVSLVEYEAIKRVMQRQ